MTGDSEAYIWSRFSSLLAEIDRVFHGLRSQFPDEVRCGEGCDDCCHAVFFVSLVEGEFLARFLREMGSMNEGKLAGIRRRSVAYPEEMRRQIGGQATDQAMYTEQLSRLRLRCPLLGDDGRCQAYEARPVTCRVYGLPTELSGLGHVCGFSGFEAGRSYPTVKLDRINIFLLDLSVELAVLRGLPEKSGRAKKYFFEFVDS